MIRLIFIAILSISTNSFGQTNKFDSLASEMFFNIPSFHPDSSVLDFVKKYFPVFTKKYVPGGWTAYGKEIPEFQLTVHSFIFTRHPYFDMKFREGQLDIFASETKEGPAGVRDFQVCFMFDQKKDADSAFNKLSAMFKGPGIKKKIITKPNKKIAEFTPPYSFFYGVYFICVKDELNDKKYKLFFRMGRYADSQ
jgi:hypothetical protein